MKYLCIETSQSIGFVALFHNQKKEFEHKWNEHLHSENIVDSLKTLLPLLDSSIEFIAVNTGPGRFTGIRAGVNFAKVLSYYLKRPLYPCVSLRIMVENHLHHYKCPIISILEAFGQMYYTGIYQKTNQGIITLLPPQALPLKQLQKYISNPMVGVGDIFNKSDFSGTFFQNLKLKKPIPITPKLFSQYIRSHWNEKNLQNWQTIEPCYLRLPSVINKNVL